MLHPECCTLREITALIWLLAHICMCLDVYCGPQSKVEKDVMLKVRPHSCPSIAAESCLLCRFESSCRQAFRCCIILQTGIQMLHHFADERLDIAPGNILCGRSDSQGTLYIYDTGNMVQPPVFLFTIFPKSGLSGLFLHLGNVLHWR